MNDDRRSTDERIASAARELYHAPPETPREEMWSAIEARLEAAGPAVVRLDAVRARRSGGAGWWIAIAAALLIGLGIGRLSMSTDPGESPVAAASDAAETPALVHGPEGDAESGADEAEAETPGAPSEDAPPRLADGGVAAEATPSARQEDRPSARGSLSYAVATRQHLDRSEAFLTGVRANPALESPDPQFEAWARSLLTRTRVLMESPATRDPATRRLLEDLELMLAQIAVTAATGDSGEARILGRGLEEGNLLYRLRSATDDESGPGTVRTDGTSSL